MIAAITDGYGRPTPLLQLRSAFNTVFDVGVGDRIGFDWDACFGIDMNEIKAKMSDLFKDGENFKFKEVDYSSKKMQKVIAAVKKEQERIRKSTELPPLSDLFWHTPFNI